MTNQSRNVGRPQTRPDKHPLCYAIILYDALLRFGSLVGNNYSERFAAQASVLAVKSCGWVYDKPMRYSVPPNNGVAGISLRKSPVKKSLENGYLEIAIGHVTDKQPDRYLQSLADVVRKTHRRWLRQAETREWLYRRSYALASFVFPQVSRLRIFGHHLRTS